MTVKTGDLALVVCGENSGHIVEVLGVLAPFDDGESGWKCRSRDQLTCEHPITGELSHNDVFRVRQSWLRPITGLPINENERDEVPA